MSVCACLLKQKGLASAYASPLQEYLSASYTIFEDEQLFSRRSMGAMICRSTPRHGIAVDFSDNILHGMPLPWTSYNSIHYACLFYCDGKNVPCSAVLRHIIKTPNVSKEI